MLNSIKVISLDKTPERFLNFKKINAQLPIERISACEGAMLKKEEYIEAGIFSRELEYSAGALGCAISHIRLWQQAVSENSVRHIAEDDAIIRDDFYQVFTDAEKHFKDWDVFLWGYNYDWPVGLSSYFDTVSSLEVKNLLPDFLYKNYHAFKIEKKKPSLLPLVSAAGTGFYSVSPQGAQKLLKLCLPLSMESPKYIKDESLLWHNNGLDVEMSRHYRLMNSYISFPSMALMINNYNNSTIQNEG